MYTDFANKLFTSIESAKSACIGGKEVQFIVHNFSTPPL